VRVLGFVVEMPKDLRWYRRFLSPREAVTLGFPTSTHGILFVMHGTTPVRGRSSLILRVNGGVVIGAAVLARGSLGSLVMTEAALASVRQYGGVLEHPEATHAFARFGLRKPRWCEGWMEAGDGIGFVCCVAQGHYGHRARKLTWLYAVSTHLPVLDWSIPPPRSRLDYGFHSAEERRSRQETVAPRVNASRLTTTENLSTPLQFRDILLKIARFGVIGES
jgi:hypothetical protein